MPPIGATELFQEAMTGIAETWLVGVSGTYGAIIMPFLYLYLAHESII